MKTVLVVDDSKSLRKVISLVLKANDYAVVDAAHGLEALARIGSCKIDIVVTDINMPHMDGIELVRQIRALQGTSRFIPIIMLTAEGRLERIQEGKIAGATAWIVKPFNPEDLLMIVKKILD